MGKRKVKIVKVSGKRRGKPRVKRVVRRPKRNQVSAAGRVLPERIAPNSDLFVIEDTTVKMMLADPRFLEAVPCLGEGKTRLSKALKKCGHCGDARSKATKRAMASIRQCMSALVGDQRTKLKKLLGAKKVRIVMKGNHVTY